MMIPIRVLLPLVVALVLMGCGPNEESVKKNNAPVESNTNPASAETIEELSPADEVRAEKQVEVIEGKLGFTYAFDDAAFTLQSVIPLDTTDGVYEPVAEVGFRIDNHRDDNVMFDINLVCANLSESVESGSWYAGSTYDPNSGTPGQSFEEAMLRLGPPDEDGYPLCSEFTLVVRETNFVTFRGEPIVSVRYPVDLEFPSQVAPGDFDVSDITEVFPPAATKKFDQVNSYMQSKGYPDAGSTPESMALFAELLCEATDDYSTSFDDMVEEWLALGDGQAAEGWESFDYETSVKDMIAAILTAYCPDKAEAFGITTW